MHESHRNLVVVVFSLLGIVAANGRSDEIGLEDQELLEVPILILDEETDEPIANAKIMPWAIRSSLGHGLWSEKDKGAKVSPQPATTADNGIAKVLYPKFRLVKEQVKSIGVSVSVDHPEYGFQQAVHIDDLPLLAPPYQVRLKKGVPCEFQPTIDGKPVELKHIHGFWSDGRSWQARERSKNEDDGLFRLGAMSPGKNSVLLAMKDGEHVSHFSKLTEFVLKVGERFSMDLPLEPAKRIDGVLSEDVPRPIKNGRIKVQTLDPGRQRPGDNDRVSWFTWAPVQPDGTFTIPGWPADEKLQLVALCDGYIAKSGDAPPEAPGGGGAPMMRPQVFEPDEEIIVEMTPLVNCEVTLNDADEEPIAGIEVASWPNIFWWNGGSQIYCHPLVRCEEMLLTRDYRKAVDNEFAQPFTATSNALGVATLQLPVGKQGLAIKSDVYELPVFLGRRSIRVELKPDQTTETQLELQPAGTEKLGDWDKLAGIVFGCSTREGRRIGALPEVRKKMDDFTAKFREGKNQRDPELIAEAFTLVATAFEDVGDFDEAVKWHAKATKQFEQAQ